MKSILIPLLLFTTHGAFAGVSAYSGDSGEKLYIESASALGKETYLLKFEGVESPWAGKVIQAKRTVNGSDKESFAFDYELELSSGVQKRTYQIVTDAGQELVKGSRVKKVELHYQDNAEANKSIKLNQDRKLTEASQKINLPSENKKSPFKPDVN